MTIPLATKDTVLNALLVTHASAHNGYPGTTGANEISGGTPAYGRKAITLSASSAGSGRSLSAAVTFDVPATTVKWLGLWNNTTFIAPLPNGGETPRNFIAVPSTDTFYSTAHGFTDGKTITFFGVPPTGITEGATVFARDCTADTFKVAATAGGAAIDITSGASYGCFVVGITEQVYAAQNTHQLATGQIVYPD